MRFSTVAAVADGVLVAGVNGQRIAVYGLVLASTDTESFTLQSGASGTQHVGDGNVGNGRLQMIIGHQFRLDLTGQPWFQCDVGADLRIDIEGVAGDFAGLIVYDLVDKDISLI